MYTKSLLLGPLSMFFGIAVRYEYGVDGTAVEWDLDKDGMFVDVHRNDTELGNLQYCMTDSKLKTKIKVLRIQGALLKHPKVVYGYIASKKAE